MVKDQSRRNFLWTASLAAAVALPLTDTLLSASTVPAAGDNGQGMQMPKPAPFKVITVADLQAAGKAAVSAPNATKDLISDATVPFLMVVTTEGKKAGAEFEYHEGRDHILQVVEGSTSYEVGGTPKNAHSPKAGEWLAPVSEGATKVTLNKGDMLVMPRGTPHRRTTAEGVTFMLISPTGMLM